MSVETTAGNESPVTTADSTADAIETFVATVTDALVQSGAPDATVASVETAGGQLAERVRADHEQRDDERDSVARQVAEVRGDLHDLTETVESQEDAETEPSATVSSDAKGGGQTGEDGATKTPPSPETPLEDTLRLPDGVASDSLSANQQRARSVARDIGDYAEYNHQYGNYSLTAKRLRIVLKAQSDGDAAAHHETVKRVRRFLDRLGESEVTVTEDRGGTKRLVFAESLVERIESYVDAEAHGGVRHDTVGTGVET